MTYTYDETAISLDAPLTKGEFLHFINTRFNPLEKDVEILKEEVSNIRLEMKSMAEMIIAAIQSLEMAMQRLGRSIEILEISVKDMERKWEDQLRINNHFEGRICHLESIV